MSKTNFSVFSVLGIPYVFAGKRSTQAALLLLLYFCVWYFTYVLLLLFMFTLYNATFCFALSEKKKSCFLKFSLHATFTSLFMHIYF